jgi:cytochrome P450
MKEMDREIYDLVEGIIKKRETEMKNGKANNDDLLGILIESNNLEIQGHEKSKTAGMSYDELVKECKQFYIAGQETTSSLLVWTMVLLARYPEWQELARQEVLQVFGNQIPNHNGLNNQLKIVSITHFLFMIFVTRVKYIFRFYKYIKFSFLVLDCKNFLQILFYQF